MGWRVLLEQQFELARQRLNPSAPGRLTSCFVFDDLDAAHRAAPALGRLNMLYSVELVDANAPQHRADFNLVTMAMQADNTDFFRKVDAAAEKYWAGEISGTPEILTSSAMRILELVNSEP